MSFQQVFYTSCKEGLEAGKGFQVNACSPDIPPVILKQVERLGLYERPLSTPARPTPEELEIFPISLFFQILNDENSVIGHAKYLGVDYTNRPGNFFTHSLISNNPYEDFHQVNRILPIETWGGHHWTTEESNSIELPVLEKITFGEKIDFLNIKPFLQNSDRQRFIPAFLTAVVESLKTKRRIIIVDDNENIAFWIAVASYVLPYHLVLNLTFNTYVQNPYHNEALITGTTEDSSFNFAPHEIEHQYFVFDFKGKRFTTIEPDGFAVKCAFLYVQAEDEVIVDFALFVDQIAPNLPIEELEDALSTYCYFENINLPDVNNINVLNWCSKYLERLADRDFRSLFGKLVNERPVKTETLQACTNFYLAALDSKIDASIIEQIENLYIQWLICEAISAADNNALIETEKKLPRLNYTGENLERVFGDWMGNLKETSDSTHFTTVFQIGNKLGFFTGENQIFRVFGTRVVGKWITNPAVKNIIKEISVQPGGVDLLEGIGEFLAGQTNNLPLFSSLADVIAESSCYRILSDYAVKKNNFLLYIRLDSIRTNILSAQSDRVQILNEQLKNIQRDFHTELTSEIVQASFNAVWLNQSPTLIEANQLFLPPLREFVIQSDIPSTLVDSLKLNVDDFEESAQHKLITTLSSEDVRKSLGEKSFLLEAHRLMSDLRSDLLEMSGKQIVATLVWAAKHHHHISEIAPALETNLAYSLFKVKKAEDHSEILLACFDKNSINFLKAYEERVGTILRGNNNQAEIARLLKTWIISAQSNKNFSTKYFAPWSQLTLKSQSKKSLDKIEEILRQLDFKVAKDWMSIREMFEKDQAGILKKFFGGIFKR